MGFRPTPTCTVTSRFGAPIDSSSDCHSRLASIVPKRTFLNSFGNSFAKKSSTFFAGEHFLPADPPPAFVSFFDCGVEHADTRAPDVWSRTVALDVRNCWIVGNVESAVCQRDSVFVCGHKLLILSQQVRESHAMP